MYHAYTLQPPDKYHEKHIARLPWAGTVDDIARADAVRLLEAHQKRQKETAARYRQHRALEKQQQAAKAARIAERERRAAEKRRRKEDNERNRLRNLERKAAEERAREAARRGEKTPLPEFAYRKNRRLDPRGIDPKGRKP